MNLVTFPLRVKPELKTAISGLAASETLRGRALVENRSQNDLINSVMKLYLSENPYRQKTVS